MPAALLAVEVEVRRRLGVELNPVDPSTGEGLRLLSCFVAAGAARDRLREAAAAVARDPPELVRGATT